MRALTKNEFAQVGGGTQAEKLNVESRNFMLGAGITWIFSAVFFETSTSVSLLSALAGGVCSSLLLNPKDQRS